MVHTSLYHRNSYCQFCGACSAKRMRMPTLTPQDTLICDLLVTWILYTYTGWKTNIHTVMTLFQQRKCRERESEMFAGGEPCIFRRPLGKVGLFGVPLSHHLANANKMLKEAFHDFHTTDLASLEMYRMNLLVLIGRDFLAVIDTARAVDYNLPPFCTSREITLSGGSLRQKI